MPRYLTEISYCGTSFSGWQAQPNANTVQEEIEKALSSILKDKIQVVGCGRTDAGVHALQSYFHFDHEGLDIDTTVFRLNMILPADIAIHKIQQVDEDFHARFDAISRSYEYLITFKKDPFNLKKVWKFPHGLAPNLDLLNEAASLLLEFEEFYSFSKSNTDVKTYKCTVSRALWHCKDEYLVFDITANRFLRGMVRLIVGMCVNVSRNRLTIQEVREALEQQKRFNPSFSVPAHGLYLKNVIY